MDLVELVGRPVPPSPPARDVILAGLSSGEPRYVDVDCYRLTRAIPDLLRDGVIIKVAEGFQIAKDAMPQAHESVARMVKWRGERRDWGIEFQRALRARRVKA